MWSRAWRTAVIITGTGCWTAAVWAFLGGSSTR